MLARKNALFNAQMVASYLEEIRKVDSPIMSHNDFQLDMGSSQNVNCIKIKMTCKCPRVNGVKMCGWKALGSMIEREEISGVIYKIM